MNSRRLWSRILKVVSGMLSAEMSDAGISVRINTELHLEGLRELFAAIAVKAKIKIAKVYLNAVKQVGVNCMAPFRMLAVYHWTVLITLHPDTNKIVLRVQECQPNLRAK